MTNPASITIEPRQPATHCLIWLHGLGAGPEDFAPLAKHLQFPESVALRYIFPAAPLRPLSVNQGYVLSAWYDILAMQPERVINQQHLQAVSQQLQRVIEQQISQGIASENIVIAGFSQGGAVAYQLALNFALPLGGLLCMSTYLMPASLPSKPQQAQLPILIQHGQQDDVVAPSLGERAHQQLLQQQYQVELEYYQMAHSVSPSQIKTINHWLIQRFC